MRLTTVANDARTHGIREKWLQFRISKYLIAFSYNLAAFLLRGVEQMFWLRWLCAQPHHNSKLTQQRLHFWIIYFGPISAYLNLANERARLPASVKHSQSQRLL